VRARNATDRFDALVRGKYPTARQPSHVGPLCALSGRGAATRGSPSGTGGRSFYAFALSSSPPRFSRVYLTPSPFKLTHAESTASPTCTRRRRDRAAAADRLRAHRPGALDLLADLRAVHVLRVLDRGMSRISGPATSGLRRPLGLPAPPVRALPPPLLLRVPLAARAVEAEAGRPFT
jgi:hypothetical protein